MTSPAPARRVFVRSSPSPRSLERDGHDSLFPHLEHPRSSRHHPQRDPLGEPPLPSPGFRDGDHLGEDHHVGIAGCTDADAPAERTAASAAAAIAGTTVSRAYASSRDTFSPAFAAFSSPCFFPSSARRLNRFRNDTATRTASFASSSASDAANARATAAVSAVSSGRHVICTGMIFSTHLGAARSPARTAFASATAGWEARRRRRRRRRRRPRGGGGFRRRRLGGVRRRARGESYEDEAAARGLDGVEAESARGDVREFGEVGTYELQRFLGRALLAVEGARDGEAARPVAGEDGGGGGVLVALERDVLLADGVVAGGGLAPFGGDVRAVDPPASASRGVGGERKGEGTANGRADGTGEERRVRHARGRTSELCGASPARPPRGVARGPSSIGSRGGRTSAGRPREMATRRCRMVQAFDVQTRSVVEHPRVLFKNVAECVSRPTRFRRDRV